MSDPEQEFNLLGKKTGIVKLPKEDGEGRKEGKKLSSIYLNFTIYLFFLSRTNR